MDDLKFMSNIIIKGKIKLLTGLHIGGNANNFEIGGIDNPVIRDPITNLPYIPGSSLKGKLRAELEWFFGVINNENNEKHMIIKNIFGDAVNRNNNNITRGKLIVRDAYPEGYDKLDLTKDLFSQDDNILSPTLKMWKELETGLLYTEWKIENKINRITSEAKPRSIERVPAGSIFDMEMVYTCYSNKDEENLKYIEESFHLLEDSYLGGNGTRGYGKIKFENIQYIKRTKGYYEGREEEKIITIKEMD